MTKGDYGMLKCDVEVIIMEIMDSKCNEFTSLSNEIDVEFVLKVYTN